MPQSKKGTIHIDIAELETLVQQLKHLKDALDDQKCHIPLLQHKLDHAISGTAVNIRKFDERFDHWMKLLGNVITDIDTAYLTLKLVLEEAREHDLADVLEALRKGSKVHSK